MEYLLDTNLVLWSLYESDKLPNEIRIIIDDDRNDIYVSMISIWEVAIKHLKNPNAMPVSGTDFYNDCLKNNYYILPLLAKEIVEYESLKIKDDSYVNKDPFDRMLIAQADHKNFLLCSCDSRLKYYDNHHIIMY